MAIVRINEFTAAPNQAAGLRHFLSSVIATVTAAPGCLGCELLIAHEDPTRLAIIETWESIAAHQAAATRIPPEKMAEVKALLGEAPRGRYYDRE
jgi:quinol monooxygenase YgiN